jgi:hypothetical protein
MVNVDGSDDGEKRRVTFDGVERSVISELVRRRHWHGRLVKSDESESWAWVRIPFRPD